MRCKKINRSHTHTPTENNTPDTVTHTHDKNNTPNSQTNTRHKHLTTRVVIKRAWLRWKRRDCVRGGCAAQESVVALEKSVGSHAWLCWR